MMTPLSPEEVNNLSPMALNEQVARKLGHEIIPHPDSGELRIRVNGESLVGMDKIFWLAVIPDYSRSIEAAWEIVEREHKDGYFRMTDDYEYTPNGKKLVYRCIFGVHNSAGFVEATADTAPMAICLSFLKLP